MNYQGMKDNRGKDATIILAAGKGNRISKLTCTRPKATLKLNGLSIIRRTCEFVENCQPGYTKSSCHLEVDAKLPLAVFAQSNVNPAAWNKSQ